MMQTRMLSKEDEVAAGGDENEVRREDQEKINRFSRLHQRESVLEALLQGKQVRFSLSFQTPICHEMGDAKPEQKDKEDLEEITTELELADEDELVPYKIGDTFFQLPLAEAQALLATSTEEAEGEVTKLEESMGDLREELQQLKVALYARFGRGINLEA